MSSAVLDDLCAIVGYSATRAVAVWFEGKRLYVPRQPYARHPLRTLLGDTAFDELVRVAADTWFDIPASAGDFSARRNREIAERFAAGASTAEVASETGLHRRHVQKIRVELIAMNWLDYAGGTVGGRFGTKPTIFSKRGTISSDPPSERTRARAYAPA